MFDTISDIRGFAIFFHRGGELSSVQGLAINRTFAVAAFITPLRAAWRESGSFGLRTDRHSHQAKEQAMSNKDRASNRAQDAKGRVKEAAGSITGNRDLKNKGVTDQAKAEMKVSLEDAGYKVKGAATP
jgi:uncharacterized protein YjbJ (UPF0337 family)